ncbi:hypothetical protein POX_a00317 [Penicillium oxalicum]|uniref:hypothetical protein n=1 Tax=Penicillium oxalicum TaxID=69781 RepID=UPI0020B8D281|nr:hypothetical protein POX_a00317 [Penicillium oxalicum]KAI2793733.1 hypothetical protein POX_a00317 [Penicillium oxalicum]
MSGMETQIPLPTGRGATPRDQPSAIVKYQPLEGVEDPNRYQHGGFHPVTLNAVLNDRYVVRHKLGWGRFSTVWLAVDMGEGEHYMQNVAIKVGAARNGLTQETAVLERLQEPSSIVPTNVNELIPPALSSFQIHGINGIHPCLVTSVGGATLEQAKWASSQGILRLDVVRILAAQLVTAVAHVHEKGIVHGDLTLSSVLLHLPYDVNSLTHLDIVEAYGPAMLRPVQRIDGQPLTAEAPQTCVEPIRWRPVPEEITPTGARIMLADYGESWTADSQVRCDSTVPDVYQPPEARWDPRTPMSRPSDIWTLACTLWDLVAWYPLFGTWYHGNKDITAEQNAVLGKLPRGWYSQWGRKSSYRRSRFDHENRPIDPEKYPDLEGRFETVVQRCRREMGMATMEEAEKEAFLEMLRSMLKWQPAERLTADAILRSSWMKHWALPEWDRQRMIAASFDQPSGETGEVWLEDPDFFPDWLHFPV